jgi:hypothetical protein
MHNLPTLPTPLPFSPSQATFNYHHVQAFLTSLYSTFCAKELEYPLPCSRKPTTGPYPEPLESIFRVVLWTVHCCCSFEPNIIGQQNRESYSVGPVGRANVNLLSCYLRPIFVLPQVDAYTTGIFSFIKFSNKNLFRACYMSLPSVLHAFNLLPANVENMASSI